MISVIIVTYNSAAHIARCLESLAPTDAELIVVDNASRDDTVDAVRKFSRVKLIQPGANLGFAGGCNLGARQSNGEVLLFLNPDTSLRSSLAPMERALQENPNCVAAGAQLVDASGLPQRGFLVRRFPSTTAVVFEMLLINRLLPNNPVNRRYRYWDMDPTQPANVDQPAGAALMVKRRDFEAVGGFDERFYPLWFEDVDLCLRLKRAGGMIAYIPDVVIEHQGGHSLASVDFSEKQVYWYRNLIYYVGKNLGWRASCLVRAALLCGLGLRITAELTGLVIGPIIEWISSRPRTQSRVRNARVEAYWRAARVAFASHAVVRSS